MTPRSYARRAIEDYKPLLQVNEDTVTELQSTVMVLAGMVLALTGETITESLQIDFREENHR